MALKPRVAIVGGGIYGTTVLKAYSSAHRMGQIELAALAEIKEDILQEQTAKFNLRGYTDYKEMFRRERLDAVAIVTPDHLHREIALEAAGHGLHTLVQKPLDVSVGGAREMVAAAKKNGVMLFVDFHKRCDPGHVQLKQAIKAGKLGRLQYGYIWMEDQIFVPSIWFKRWAQYSSPAWFIGIHFFDLLYWLLESKPKRIYATAIKDKLAGTGIDTYDSVQAKIEFANGTNFSVDTSWIIPNSFSSSVNQGIRIVGSNGVWEVDSQDRGITYAIEEDKGCVVPNPYSLQEKENPFYGLVPQGYVIESMLNFLPLVAHLKDGTRLEDLRGCYPSGEEAIVSTQICEAAHLSAATGKIIECDEE